jgi:hypothetical protein
VDRQATKAKKRRKVAKSEIEMEMDDQEYLLGRQEEVIKTVENGHLH